MSVAVRRTAEAVLVQRHHRRARPAHPAARRWCRPPAGSAWRARSASVIAASFVLLVLPAALVLFGRWVFWPRVPHVGDADAGATPTRCGTGSATASPGGRPRSSPAPLVLLGDAWRSASSGSTPASTRPTSSSSSPRRSPPPSGWRESFPAGVVRPGPGAQPATTPTRCSAAVEAVGRRRDRRGSPQQGDGDHPDRRRARRRPGTGEAARDDRARCATRSRRSTDTHVAGTEATAIDEARARPAGPAGDPPADPAARARRAVPAAAGRRGAAAARRDRAGDVRREHGRRLVAVHRAARLRGARLRGAAAGVPVPGRARRRLQHLPGDPGPRGGRGARHPRAACCARSPPPAA